MKYFLLGLLLALTGSLSAQSYYYQQPLKGNPKGLNTESDQLNDNGGEWVLIMDSSLNPTYSKTQALPVGFNFTFAGQAVSHFKVSSTGFLTFDTLAANAPIVGPQILPSNSLPNQSIVIWGMNASGNNDKVVCKVFGNPPNRQFWVKFYSMSTPGDSNSYSYWSMVLEEGTQDVFLVSMNHGSGLTYQSPKHTPGIQVNATNATMIQGGPNYTNNLLGESYKDNLSYRFSYGVQAVTDIEVVEFNLPILTLAGNNNVVKVPVRNLGSQAVNTLKLHYRINQGAEEQFDITGLNIKASSASLDTLVASKAIAAITPGELQQVKVWISNVNGGSEANKRNDSAIAHTTVYAGTAPKSKTAILEYATGAWCSTCPPADVVVSKIQQELGDSVIAIAHHTADGMVFSGDSFSRGWIDSFPRAVVSRKLISASHNDWLSTTRAAMQYPRWADMAVKNMQVDTQGLLTWTVTAKMLDYVAAADVRLGSMVLEDNIRGNGQGYDQQIANQYLIESGSSFYGKSSPMLGYFHQNVATAAPTGVMGSAIKANKEVLAPGDSFSWNMQYRFPKLLKKEFMPGTAQFTPKGTDIFASGKPIDMKVAAWLSLHSSKVREREIVAAAQAKLWDLKLSSKKLEAASWSVFPNPASSEARIVFGELNFPSALMLYSATGQLAWSRQVGKGQQQQYIDIPIDSLSNGIYLLVWKSPNGAQSMKLLVNR